MTCADCGDLEIWAPNLKVREGVVRCRACDRDYILSQPEVKALCELEREPSAIVEALSTAVEKVKLKVRVPGTCAACGFVEGPDATRMDQVFERYGRPLCRPCRKRTRNGTRRRRRSRRGESSDAH